MKIIGGSAKGRKLLGLPRKGEQSKSVRPTSARAREAVFNIIAPYVSGSHILDLFAGTGAMGIEALSRGAQTAKFIDNNPAVIKLISRNLDLCKLSDKAQIIQLDLIQNDIPQSIVPPGGFSLVFIDPPYGLTNVMKIFKHLGTRKMISPGGGVIFEYSAKEVLPEVFGTLKLHDKRRYGAAGIWIYKTTGGI